VWTGSVTVGLFWSVLTGSVTVGQFGDDRKRNPRSVWCGQEV
jgi:hypothetical protein